MFGELEVSGEVTEFRFGEESGEEAGDVETLGWWGARLSGEEVKVRRSSGGRLGESNGEERGGEGPAEGDGGLKRGESGTVG